MSKLLIYIGENQKFEVPDTIRVISSFTGTSNAREGKFIGTIFECDYTFQGVTTVVRISEDAETVTAEGLGDEALDFALKLQAAMSKPLSAIDMDYSFNVRLNDYKGLSELRSAISS
jgi:hypothetical protein